MIFPFHILKIVKADNLFNRIVKAPSVPYDGPFTKSLYWKDIENNGKEIVKDKKFALSDRAHLAVWQSKSNLIQATIKRVHAGRYQLTFFRGLADALFSLSEQVVEVFGTRFNLEREQCHRLIAGSASEIIYWHEFAHLARGHISVLDECFQDVSISELATSRVVESTTQVADQKNHSDTFSAYSRNDLIRLLEIDADIYGAIFTLGRITKVLKNNKNIIPAKEWLLAHFLGVRTAYAVLHQKDPTEDQKHKLSSHPHSRVRSAYALSHSISKIGVRSFGVTDDTAIGLFNELFIEFDKKIFHDITDSALLQGSLKELAAWRTFSDLLIPYQLLQVKE